MKFKWTIVNIEFIPINSFLTSPKNLLKILTTLRGSPASLPDDMVYFDELEYDVPPRTLNPQPLQSHSSLDITLSLSPITPLDHIHDIPSPPSPPQPQPSIMGHPLYYDYQGWIQSCLSSSRGLIIVNGSPTEEFQFHKGMFEGFSIGTSLQLSHLFYADDVVFMGHWSDSNINIIVQVLECFFRASDLRINMQKSKLMGIAVDDDKVTQVAYSIGCLTFTTPFSYLGVKVGGLMSRTQAWDGIVNKLLARLSKLKMKTLSIGGRLTLIKLVLGLTPIYYMSMFKVPMQVLNRMEAICGRFFNGVDDKEKRMTWALMFKWVWRFRNDNNSLWARVIRALHGENGSIGTSSKHAPTWLDIVRGLEKLKSRRIDLLGFIKKRVGNVYALETSKNITLAHKLAQDNVGVSLRRCPRGGTEFEQFTSLMASLEGYTLHEIQYRWVWSLTGSGEFFVALVRRYIDDHMLPDVSSKTRWLKAVSD
ncbi:hypothetical protein Tco_0548874 [Tanacetum coccineum]